MRKTNKVLMATVAILLCLVLMTTSVVSGIFARFVITKEATATVGLKAFGVELVMTPSNELKSSGATVGTEVKNGESGTITITGLKMGPGDDFTDAVNFKFTGEPTVPVKIKITSVVVYNGIHNTNKDFAVPNGAIDGITSDTYFMPIGFTFSANATTADGNYVVGPWLSSSTKASVNASYVQNAIASGIKGKIDGATVSGNVVTTARLDSGKDVSLKIGGTATSSFNMGFAWPFDYSGTYTQDQFDTIATYIAENTNASSSFTVTYTVRIEQVA